MILDTSALIAIAFQEPEAEALASAIARSDTVRMSTGNLLETRIVVLARKGDRGLAKLSGLLDAARVEPMPVTQEHVDLALGAFDRFGKGRHPAGLNFGDCFAYALAKALGEPLLFKGGDFSQTDIAAAPW